jgi:hypothetical protein
MLAKDLLEFQNQLRSTGTMFAYCGYVTEQVLTGVGEALKQKLVIDDMDMKTARSVFAVFVEQMQNIIRYSADREGPRPATRGEGATSKELRFGIMTIGRQTGFFVVKAGNLVENADIEQMRVKLEQIRNADRDQLKAMYMGTLKSEPEEGSSGAGVGFIEIARRASKPIEFDFAEFDDRFSFFALEAAI